MKGLKRRLLNGETLKGCWLNLGSSVTAEIVGLAGFDWVLVDLEHGSGFESDLPGQLQALEHTGAAAIVRVESLQRQGISRVLDLGAEGIMCPRVDTAHQAGQVVEAMRYPPDGTRGVARMVRASGFGRDFHAYRAASGDELLAIIQIETVEALRHLDDIAALQGVDVLFIGPADLSMELGCYGRFDDPRFVQAVTATVAAAERAGKATGILLSNPDDFAPYRQMGARFIACGADSAFVAEGARSMLTRLETAASTDRPATE